MSQRDYSDFEAHQANGLAWAVDQWVAQVQNRPLDNVHRETLDNVWRQVVQFHGGDPDKLLGPSHQMLVAYANKQTLKKMKAELRATKDVHPASAGTM